MEALMDVTYGMYILGTKYNKRNVGCFVNTVSQVTAKDPIISVSINKENYTNEAIRNVKIFSVSILAENASRDIISRFGFFSSKNIDKFENTKYENINNVPVVMDNICGYIICECIDIIDCKTHDIILAKVIETKKVSDLVPMTYKYYHDTIKLKAPKTAPTYIEESNEVDVKDTNKYRCIVCGHIYDETVESVKFADLPDDWKCPICGVGKDMFKKM